MGCGWIMFFLMYQRRPKAAPQLHGMILSDQILWSIVFQWQFDLAQLYHDGIYANPSAPAAVAAYAQGSRANLTASFGATAQPRHFFSPSCYQHVVLNNKHSGWMQVTAGSVTLPDALDAFVNGTSTPSTLLDVCTTPDCNPTCPPPQNIG